MASARRRQDGSGVSFGFGSKARHSGLRYLKAFLFIIVVAGVVAGFAFLDGYVKQQTYGSRNGLPVELVGDIPDWVSDEIKNRVYAAAAADGQALRPDENAAASVQRNVEWLVPWLDDVRVRTTHNGLLVTGKWRKPIALVSAGKEKFYIDDELVILDYVPAPGLSVVAVTGLEFSRRPPVPGEVWRGDDLAAALAVLTRLERMDATVAPTRPLLRQIDRIDVANFGGRKSNRQPHIVLYTKDNTEIIWGAEIGAWQRHLESPDEDKLARLYAHYEEYGTLAGVKYINLRDPQQTVYLPIDKY